MTNYTFKKDRDTTNKFDTTNVVIECDTESLSDLVDAFNDFLVACGFSRNHQVEVVNTTEEDP